MDWINLKERPSELPWDNQRILVVTEHSLGPRYGTMQMMDLGLYHQGLFRSHRNPNGIQFTHWMPAPEFPKQDRAASSLSRHDRPADPI